MATRLLTAAGDLDRAALMRDAHKRYREGQRLRLGWTFAQCLATAQAAAKIQRNETIMEAIKWRVLNSDPTRKNAKSCARSKKAS